MHCTCTHEATHSHANLFKHSSASARQIYTKRKTCLHTHTRANTRSHWWYKQLKRQGWIIASWKTRPANTLGSILEGIQRSKRTPDTNTTNMTHYFVKSWMEKRMEWRMEADDRGRKRQQGTGWNTAEGMREDKSFQLSVQLCVCVCVYLCIHVCTC